MNPIKKLLFVVSYQLVFCRKLPKDFTTNDQLPGCFGFLRVLLSSYRQRHSVAGLGEGSVRGNGEGTQSHGGGWLEDGFSGFQLVGFLGSI